jgi:hypothetical protein
MQREWATFPVMSEKSKIYWLPFRIDKCRAFCSTATCTFIHFSWIWDDIASGLEWLRDSSWMTALNCNDWPFGSQRDTVLPPLTHTPLCKSLLYRLITWRHVSLHDDPNRLIRHREKSLVCVALCSRDCSRMCLTRQVVRVIRLTRVRVRIDAIITRVEQALCRVDRCVCARAIIKLDRLRNSHFLDHD